MEQVKVEMERLCEICRLMRAYQEATARPRPLVSALERRTRELERINPYFSRYTWTSPLKEVCGKWPGDETIEQILDVLSQSNEG